MSRLRFRGDCGTAEIPWQKTVIYNGLRERLAREQGQSTVRQNAPLYRTSQIRSRDCALLSGLFIIRAYPPRGWLPLSLPDPPRCPKQ